MCVSVDYDSLAAKLSLSRSLSKQMEKKIVQYSWKLTAETYFHHSKRSTFTYNHFNSASHEHAYNNRIHTKYTGLSFAYSIARRTDTLFKKRFSYTKYVTFARLHYAYPHKQVHKHIYGILLMHSTSKWLWTWNVYITIYTYDCIFVT